MDKEINASSGAHTILIWTYGLNTCTLSLDGEPAPLDRSALKGVNRVNELGKRITYPNSYSIEGTTVLPAKSDSDDMFCLQSDQGLLIDRSPVY